MFNHTLVRFPIQISRVRIDFSIFILSIFVCILSWFGSVLISLVLLLWHLNFPPRINTSISHLTLSHLILSMVCALTLSWCRRAAPAPPKRTRRRLPSCPCRCPRSETWTLPTMPTMCWSPLSASYSMETSLRTNAGTLAHHRQHNHRQHNPRQHNHQVSNPPSVQASHLGPCSCPSSPCGFQVCDEALGGPSVLCLWSGEQRPRRSVGGHLQTQPGAAETHEGAKHTRSGLSLYTHIHTHKCTHMHARIIILQLIYWVCQ